MPAGQNVNFKMDALPLPDDSSVKQEEDRQGQKVQQAAQLRPGAGFMPKTGQIAYIANNLLQGWMAGRHIQAEKKLNKAKEDVNQSRGIYDSLAGVYSQNLESGKSKDDPEMQALSKNITSAWTNYVNTADKYTGPADDGKGKKKGLGARVAGGAKKALMTNTDPEMYRSASVNLLRQTGPPVLQQEPSAQSKFTNDAAQAQSEELKDRKRWSELAKTDPAKLTPDQKAEIDGLERRLYHQSTSESVKDDLLKKVMAGTKLDDNQRQVAENMGILKPNVTNTLQWKDKEGNDYLIAIDKDGQEVGRRKLGKGWVPNDQSGASQRMFDAQINGLVGEYKKANRKPGMDENQLDQDAHRFALMAVTGFKGFGQNPMQAERNQFTLDKALKAVIGEDKDKKAMYGNFVVAPADDPNGLYFYRSNIVDPQNPEVKRWYWFNTPAQYSGGLSQEELPGAEKEFRNRLRTAIKKQNPKMSDEEINSLMPPPIYVEGGPGAKAAKGEAKDPTSMKMDPTPKHGGNHYKAIAPDGSVLAEDMTEEEMETMKQNPKFGSIQFDNKTSNSGSYDFSQAPF